MPPLREIVGRVYVAFVRALWFGAGWTLVVWRVYSGLGVAGRSLARRVEQATTGRLKTLKPRPSGAFRA